MTSSADAGLCEMQPLRFQTLPKTKYSTSLGDDAIELAATAGLLLDPWQQHALRSSLAETKPNKWAANEVAVIVPRQNGKGSILEARELAGLFLLDERLIIHSAHEFKTASEGFVRIKQLIEGSPEFSKKVKRILSGHGNEGIELKSGSRLQFMARSRGSGRGFSGDCIILDEAFALTDAQMAAMLPTLSARPNPQIWYTSSAPLMDSVTLRRVCEKGRLGGAIRMAYMEWAAESDVASGDIEAWHASNPAMGYRLDLEFIRKEYETLDDATFRRERLGIWEIEDTSSVISMDLWNALANPASKIDGNKFVFSLDVSPARSTAAIGVAGFRSDGLTHVEVMDRRPDTHWVLPRFAELRAKWGPVTCVVDGRSAAGSFIGDLQALDIDVVEATTTDVIRFTGAFYDACQLGKASLRHLGQPELNEAVAGSVQRMVGDAWLFDRKKPTADITPLVAVALAFGHWEQSNLNRRVMVY